MSDFDQYKKIGEPDKRKKAENWRVAIGLQQVDGLTPSKYLIKIATENIEGNISVEDAEAQISGYYQQNALRNRDMQIFEGTQGSKKSNKKSSEKSNKKSSEKILDAIKENPHITLQKMANDAELSVSGVRKNIDKLRHAGLIHRIGADKGGHWEINGTAEKGGKV